MEAKAENKDKFDQNETKSRPDKYDEEGRKAKRRSSADNDRRRNSDEKSKARASRTGSRPVLPGAVATRDDDDARASKKRSSNSGSSRTRDRDEKAKEKSRRGSRPAALPGAIAETNGDEKSKAKSRRSSRSETLPGAVAETDDPRERSRRRKESESRSSSSQVSSRERNRRLKEKEAAASTPHVRSDQNGCAGDVPKAAAIGVESDTFSPNVIADEERQMLEQVEEDGKHIGSSYGNKRMYKLIAVCILLIAGGVAAWFFLKPKSSNPTEAPTGEDACVAISQQQSVQGQDALGSKTFAVELTLLLAESDVNPAKLQTDLAIRLQNDVLPALAGCDGESTVASSAIANALLNFIVANNPEACDGDLRLMCSPVYIEFDLFLKEKDEPNEALIELIVGAFQDEGLLDLLNLGTSVDNVKFIQTYEVTSPTAFPSLSPSKDGDTQPHLITCSSIGQGAGPIDGVIKEHDILLDVTLDSEDADLQSVTMDLQEKIQENLMPALAGCTSQGRRLQSGDLILNAVVEAETAPDEECLATSGVPCYRFVIHWSVSRVTTTNGMFMEAANFNQDISNWQMSSVTDFCNMFLRAGSFNQNLCAWGDHIPSSTNTACGKHAIFEATSCPSRGNPNLAASPPSGFCSVCG